MDRVLDHVDIRVSDRDISQRFYDTVLTVLGLERTDEPDYVGWGDFSIVADGQPVAKHLHIAFYAASHELVDAFHRAGVGAGYTDDGAPGPRPQYREDYYGGFLRDPDSNSVEAVYTGQERATGAIDHLWLRTRDVGAIRRFYVATGHEIGVDEPDHVQIVTANASISYVADARRSPSTCTSRSASTRTRRSTPSTEPRSTRATRTTARPVSAPSTTPATTGRSSSILTATTSRPSTTTGRVRPESSMSA